MSQDTKKKRTNFKEYDLIEIKREVTWLLETTGGLFDRLYAQNIEACIINEGSAMDVELLYLYAKRLNDLIQSTLKKEQQKEPHSISKRYI